MQCVCLSSCCQLLTDSKVEGASRKKVPRFLQNFSKPETWGKKPMFVFGSFRLDVANASLQQGQKAIFLTPKTLNVLRYLVEHAGQLVTKNDLWRAVWPEVSVTDAALTVCVSELRKALGDAPKAPQYIETVHRLGYRFIAPVAVEPLQPTDTMTNHQAPALINCPRSAISYFVGREAELAQLHEWLGRALSGERQIVFVTGEAGIGKSTLVEQFLLQAQLATKGRLWLGRGQCIEHYGTGEAYLPVLDALGRLCREPQARRLVAILDQHAPAWLAQMPALLDGGGWKELQGRVAGATRERMLRELADAVEVISQEQLLVLQLEDLHWSDSSTLEWLGFLARRQEPARLLVLGTYRPVEVIVRQHPLKNLKQELQIHGHCQELPLSLLSEAAVMEYLTLRFTSADSLGSQPSRAAVRQEPLRRLAHTIHQRTDGNPLFMVNVVDYLEQRREVLNAFSDQVQSQQPEALEPQVIQTPPSISEMIEQNVERLYPNERAALEAATVAGTEFSAVAVATALERPITEIEACCAGLARQQQLIQSVGTGEWPDGTLSATFRFLHGLYRDVLHERLPAGRRAELHRRIAERQEDAYRGNAGEVAVELAYHYRLGGNRAKAVEYLELAADRSLARRAYHEAEQHYRDAIAVLAGIPESSDRLGHELSLLLRLGNVMGVTRGASASETADVYGRARSLAKRAGSGDSIPLLWGLTVTAIARGELKAALTMSHEFLEIARATSSSPGQFLAHTHYGSAYYFLGDLAASRKHLLEASDHYCDEDLRYFPFAPPIIRLVMTGAAEWHLGYPNRALHCADKMIALARRLSDPVSVCMAYAAASQLHHFTRNWARMLQATEQSLKMWVASRFPLLSAEGKIRLAYSRAQMGDTSGAAEQIREGLSELAAIEWHVTRRMVLGCLTEVCILSGDFAAAAVSLKEALEFNIDEGVFQPELLRLRGELRLLSGSGRDERFDTAEQDFRTAIHTARAASAKSDELRATTSLARLLTRRRRRDEARTLLADIYGWFTEGFDTADLKAAKLLLDELSK
jgi:DNA-binding winged helix-turn-helix (wHTH) protein/tetratricopeptide (TPR) repeat protein